MTRRRDGATARLYSGSHVSYVTAGMADLVGPAQLLDLALEFLDALRLGRGHAIAHTGIDFLALDPFQQRLRTQPILGAIRFHGRPQRWELPALLDNSYIGFDSIGISLAAATKPRSARARVT